MSRLPALSLAAAGALALAAAPAAVAAPAKKAPVVTSFSPKTVKAGQRLTVQGRSFRKGKNKNTVIFLGRRGPTVFVKADRATTTKLSLIVPARIDQALDLADGVPKASRVRFRVVSARAGRRFSTLSRSPIVVPVPGAAGQPSNGAPFPGGRAGTPPLDGDCDGDGTRNGQDGDDDNDLLSDGLESDLKADPCRADTDGDSLSDGWEYFSAKDLNVDAVPYPGKRPFPNALDPSDGETDFDGDKVVAANEYSAWVLTGRWFDPSKPASESPLGYSDGTQTSSGREAPATPAYTGIASNRAGYNPVFFNSAQFGAPAHLDRDGNGVWTDNERDADRDGLSNRGEIDGFLVAPANGVFGSVNFLDSDTDGDTLLDGEDDQDHDDVANVNEAYGSPSTNTYDPCTPDPQSRTCPQGGY